MATENESPQSQVPSAISTSTLNQTSSGFLKSFSDVAKFTVFFAFAFYTLGFIIWQSYLGNYGLSSISFLQTEYVSAAFCYLIVFLCLIFPPMLILNHALVRKHNIQIEFSFTDTLTSGYLILLLLVLIFIPYENSYEFLFTFPIPFKYAIWGYLLLLIFGCLRKYWKPQKKILWGFYDVELMDINISLVFIVSIFSNKAIDKIFVVYSVILAFLSFAFIIKQFTENLPRIHKYPYNFTLILALLGNIQYFGKHQFQYIPKQVGGGKPEKAYLKFSAQHQDLAKSLNLLPAVDIDNSNGFYGPVAILLRSENEIIFLNFQETNHMKYATPFMSNTKTNYFSNIVTNNTGSLATNVVLL